MKLSVVLLSLAALTSFAEAQRGRGRGRTPTRRPIRGRPVPGRGQVGGRPTATVTASTQPLATPSPIGGGTTPANGNNGNNNNNNNAGNGGAVGNPGNGGGNQDPQTSLTLDPRVIAKAFANPGAPSPGQVDSLTSTNNFINFCLTVANTAITDGKQLKEGSCNPAPIGVIPPVNRMPSSKFVFPKNGATLKSNEAFTIQMAVQNLQTGNFVNAQTNYFAAPQQLNQNKVIIGHTHFVIQNLTSLGQTEPTNPQQYNFFKGVNGAAVNGIVSEPVVEGVPPGFYRLCSINTSANHVPVVVAVAQHGFLDDCIYFTTTVDGQPLAAAGNNNGNGAANGNANNGAAGANGNANNGAANGNANNGGNANNAGNGTRGGRRGATGGRRNRN